MVGQTILGAAMLVLLVPSSEGIYPPGCSYTGSLALNSPTNIYNQNYPQYYVPNTNCLWVATAPAGSQINLYCQVVNLPTSPSCSGDRLRVSLSGDSNFIDEKVYCGSGTLSLTSTSNRLAIGLLATSNSVGGQLDCILTAVSTAPQCDCGYKRPTRIVGGIDSGVNEYPSMAGLIDYAVGAEVICGATIIHDRYVVSAAHCLPLIPTANMGVLVGDSDITTGTDTSAAYLYRVESAIAHPNFNYDQQTNDIAIIKTTTKITFSLYVGPICLPFRYVGNSFAGQKVTYLGWGQLFYNGPKPNVLQKVDNVNVISNSQCQQSYNNKQIVPGQMCTYTQGKDACQGDSGGPALWMDPSTYRLQFLGVISYGYACNLKPGITTRVTYYLSWIQSMTPEVSYCVK
ncbi:unnamed protein product [Psylliodes chrysocephalus]|uniref:Uncharacterized protein n=1 Tax=Psylliodes chrysocephalus TaxID=3402493 RepID=A0A9P0CKB3_9CUCU|nr:unnamed protein product [Psylliodes chrysocephala]